MNFILSRAHKLVLLVLTVCVLTTATGCPAFKDKAAAANKALIDCAKEDIGQLVGDGGATLLATVVETLVGGASGWKDSLLALGNKVTGRALACGVKAAQTALEGTMAGSGQPAGSMPAGVTRAQMLTNEMGWRFK